MRTVASREERRGKGRERATEDDGGDGGHDRDERV
jgi:hypothetical protein